MKKLNVLLLSVVTLGMTAVSCTKDDKKDENAVTYKLPMGKFIFDKISETKNGTTTPEQDINNPDCDDLNFYEFKANGVQDDQYVNRTSCESAKYTGTWTQTGNVVTTHDDGGDMTFTITALSETKMTAKQFDPKDATHFYTWTFTKQQ